MADYSSMVRYYKNKIKEGNVNCMYGLGFYYQFVAKNDAKMEKYYFMAIKLGDRDSHINYTNKYNNDYLKLGYYYQYINVDLVLMLHYYSMAVNKGCVIAMNALGYYFYRTGNYDEMKLFYEMGAEKGHIASTDELGYYYEKIQDYKQMEHYYLMSNNGNLVRYYDKVGVIDRYRFIKYLNNVPLKTERLDELVFKFKFELYDELTPMVRKFICKVHEERVVMLEKGKNVNVSLIHYGYLSVQMSTRFYHYCKENVYVVGELKMYEPCLNLINDLLTGEKILINKCNNHIIRLSLIDLFRKKLTMNELEFLHHNINFLPSWLQPYK